VSPTKTASKLTREHRRAQLAIAARTTSRLADAWILWDPDDPATIARWLDVATLIVGEAHAASAALARGYYQRVRVAAVGGSLTGTLPVPGFVAQQARTSMVVTGPVAYRRALRGGATVERAYRGAQVGAVRAGARVALTAGRDTVTAAVSRDPRAKGWIRVLGGDPCPFCIMQAQRGAVYSAGTVEFQSHANCACQPEPAF